MSFLFGLLIGASLGGSGDAPNRLPAALSEIPFRCFAAIEKSDDDYRNCRRLSMSAQMIQQRQASDSELSGIPPGRMQEAIAKALDWEIVALHELEAAAKAQNSGR